MAVGGIFWADLIFCLITFSWIGSYQHLTMVPPSCQGKSKARSQSTTFSNKILVQNWTRDRLASCACMLGCSVMPDYLRLHGPEPTKLLCPWDSPGKNPGVGCPSLLQGIFPSPRVEPASPAMAGRFFFFFNHWAACEEALTLCRIIHKFLLASWEGCFWPYSEVHHGSSDYQCKQKKRGFEVGMWHLSEGII